MYMVLSYLRGSRLIKLPSGLSTKDPNPRVKLFEILSIRSAAVVREREMEGGEGCVCVCVCVMERGGWE